MDHDNVFSASRSDPGMELVRLLSVSPPLDEGPYTATVPLESSPFVIYSREHILDQEPDLPSTPVKMRFDAEVSEANGDGDDSPVTNPYAMVDDAEASESSSPLQETHDEPDDPFIDVVDNNGQYRGSIPYGGYGYTPYDGNIPSGYHGFGVPSAYHPGMLPFPPRAHGAYHPNMYAQAANASIHFNAGVNALQPLVDGMSYAMNGTNVNMNMGHNMATNNMQNEAYLMVPVPITDVNTYFANPNVNHANGNHANGNHANGTNNANGNLHGNVGGSTSQGAYHATFGHYNHNGPHAGASGSAHGNAFAAVEASNPIGTAGQSNSTMSQYHHRQGHGNGNGPAVIHPMGANGWTSRAAANNQMRGYQDPVTLRAHMAPNPLEQARNELNALNQRLYRVTQELERAVQTFRQHINDSSNEVQRMNQMTSRLGDTTQVPVVRRGLELLSSDIRHRINLGRAVTFVNDEEEIVLTRGRQHNNRRQQGQGHQG